MSDVAENLRTFLLGDAAIARKVGLRVSQDAIPQGKPSPFIFLGRQSTTVERCLGETGNTPFSHIFAVECIGEDLDDSQSLADLVRARCDGYSGTFGDSTVQAIFVEEQADDYLPKAVDLNSGEHIAALSVEVYP